MPRRHEVGDDSFGFVLPGVDASPEIAPPAPAIRTEPNISAKRRRLSPGDAPPGPEQASSVAKASARLGALDIQSSPALSPPQLEPEPAPEPELEPQPQPEPESQPLAQPSSASSQARSSTLRSSARLNPPRLDLYGIYSEPPSVADVLEAPPVPPIEEPEDQAESDELESLPAAIPVPGSHSSIVSRRFGGLGTEEEVTESPAEAPGSGHRRRIRVSNAAATQSARLQRAVMEAESGMTAELTTSSPLARKTRRVAAAPSVPPMRSTRAASRLASSPAQQAVSSSSPITTRPPRKSDSTVASGGSVRSVRSQGRRSTLSTAIDELDDVDELSSPMAASTSSAMKPQPKARKQPLPKPPRQPTPIEEEQQSPADEGRAEEIDVHEAARRIGRKRPWPSPQREVSPELNSGAPEKGLPATKKRKKRQQESPARQAQPKTQKPKPRKSTVRKGDGGEAIPITVQRYTKRAHRNEDDTDADILSTEIPFANRGGVNVIDVLAQMCEEVLDSNLETLHKATLQAADSATKKEYRTKLRALEAFQEELRTRLLEHVSTPAVHLSS